ncbi:protease [Vespertiliibacter pulmonis]|uniref:endopeptidase La n=1 Tax=Vespertiliibacter pulmonis TaxID=1443036 RepID=A0A3N4WBX0_9PAST|nr:AAA family ATPase [Vespertiliibacter pulmonis]QLB20878.1 protease [Vespertiliibacter pulmonis]RPE83530.1 Lon-like ATP-dependent protease [Vespertiliibacter pulmonis]
MQLSPLSWKLLSINYTFEPQLQAVQFFDFQPNAKQAIAQFAKSEFGSALVLKTELFPEFLAEIENEFSQHQCSVISKMEFTSNSLFGYQMYLSKEHKIQYVPGIIQQANHQILLLNLNNLLLDIHQWDKLKQALLFRHYTPNSANVLPSHIDEVVSVFKLVLVGNRDDVATLSAYDDTLYQFCQYAEIDSYLALEEQNVVKWRNYIQSFAQEKIGKLFTDQGTNLLLNQFIRESESQKLISISPTLLKKYILGLAQFYPEQKELDHIQPYFDSLQQQAERLQQFALQDMLTDQVYIETDDEVIGQINGLSVVEFDGVPYAFGEPLRISCNAQLGEGEIHDIERKVELGGNIHSKGILLAQSCLANLLELPSQLPFSASLVFEQSYGEIDGDSSSLAIFCVLISSLAKVPLPQSFAVTGAIDQFGNVLSVGGVNQKIEGFFSLCNARGLTGKQGVIIPAVCMSHLSLNSEIIDAVKAEKFAIWAVSDVFEAIQILFARDFYTEDTGDFSDKSSIFTLINKQLQSEETSGSFWQKLYNKLFH